jgi:DNA polymerase-1
MEYKIIYTEPEIRKMLNLFSNVPAVGFDIETTAIDPRHGVIRLMQFSDGKNTFIIDCFKLENPQLLKLLNPFLSNPKPRKIVHNSKFEHRWINFHLKTEINGVFDTFLASKLLNMNQNNSLDEVAFKYLGVQIPKDQQASHWASKQLTQAQYEYAARDVVHSTELRNKLIYELYQEEMTRVAQLEFNCAPVTAHIEHSGLPVHREMYENLIRNNIEIRVADKEKELRNLLNRASGRIEQAPVFQGGLFGDDTKIEVGNGINLRSNLQLISAFADLGITLPDTSKRTIALLSKEYPELKYLTDYRMAQKLLSSFGWNILEMLDPKTGRLHANFWQLGTETGRFSCTHPNLQQMPKVMEFRECFRPTIEGRCFIICDYSQIELRILAHLSKDANMCKAFREDIDLHSMTAKGAFNLSASLDEIKKNKKEYGKYRDLAKGLNFGVVYGIGAQRFAENTGMTVREATKAIRSFYKTYGGAEIWLNNIEESGIRNRHVRTLSGRKIALDFDPDNGAMVSLARRNARNGPIQGTSGDIIKTALAMLRKELSSYDAPIVNIIHDEIIVECWREEAPQVSSIVSKTMRLAGEEYITEVPIESAADVGASWGDKS